MTSISIADWMPAAPQRQVLPRRPSTAVRRTPEFVALINSRLRPRLCANHLPRLADAGRSGGPTPFSGMTPTRSRSSRRSLSYATCHFAGDELSRGIGRGIGIFDEAPLLERLSHGRRFHGIGRGGEDCLQQRLGCSARRRCLPASIVCGSSITALSSPTAIRMR